MVSFDSDHSGGAGASLFFFHGQFMLPPPGPFACGLVGFRSLGLVLGLWGIYSEWWT
ncbi:hypothetical protein PITC_080820 [Penicillium italicum]|uniref:Uncharacterized protein n=1 Tax=Penicillium italicum TaxID=40296 RepID=A0A0A2L884_PENIT|nr:hypothetical protein PITC_080820 [Penicillium italicum]